MTDTPDTSLATATPESVAPRRGFLKMLAASAAAAATLATLPGEADARPRKKSSPGVLVFRLSTRRHHSCNACKKHHRAMVFLSKALADANRAHPGCDCPTVRHKMPIKQFERLFGANGLARSGIADLRRVTLKHARGR